MNTAPRHIEKRLILSNSLPKSWMTWAVFFFLIASLFGLLMRLFFISDVPEFLTYKNILHAHSHTALLGWGFLLVSGILTFTFITDPSKLTRYKVLLILLVLSTFGMAIAFPVEGYGLFSIVFSTIHLLLSYVFTYFFFQDLKDRKPTLAIRLIKFSLIWLLVSSLGLWAIAPVGVILGKLHPLYFMSVQWFLHFQLNGWFVYALLGLWVQYLDEKGATLSIPSWTIPVLHISLLLTYALSVAWSSPIHGLFALNAIGVLLQALAYWFFIKGMLTLLSSSYRFPSSWADKLLWIGIISLMVKALIQSALIIPDVATIAYTIRNYVIGFVHLVMLGAITFGLGAIAIKKQWLEKSSLSKIGWSIVSIAFISSEALILLQGTFFWAKLGFIPAYHQLIFWSSALFPIGLIILLIAQLSASNTYENHKPTPINQHQTKNKHAMKSTMLLSLGVALLLMISCGGGGENTGTYTPPSAKKEKAGDPRGVGEVRNVDLSPEIDMVMAGKGQAILDMKCTACHQYDGKRIVGPGFENITNRRRPEWIMNMITNVDVMLDEDPIAQQLLEECLTRMPNQNISIDESRQILEYFRKNDRERTGGSDAAAN